MQVNVTVHGNASPEDIAQMNADMGQAMGEMGAAMGGMGYAMGTAMNATLNAATNMAYTAEVNAPNVAYTAEVTAPSVVNMAANVIDNTVHGIKKEMKKEMKKAAGFIDAANKIRIELINPTGTGYYVGGDVVRGKIHLNCVVPFSCNGVILQVKGEEKSKFQDIYWETEGEGENARQVKKIRELKASKEFFNQKLVPYPTGGIIPTGVYEYPFEYPLPPNLPGCFKEKGGDWKYGDGWEGKISYKLTATVDVAFLNDLKHKVNLVINEKFDKLVQPSFAKDEKKFLIGDGKLAVNICLDKNAYFPGDRVLAKLEANNTSVKPTTKVVTKVMRHVVLHAKGERREVKHQVHRSEHPGFSPCFYGIKWLPFYVPMNVPPSTKGTLVESFYKFIIICDIPGAIDLETPLNVRILAPQFLYSTIPPQPEELPPPQDVSFRPPWEEDDKVKCCHKCGAKFSLFKRRHHCRHCGLIFCDDCTKRTSTITNLAYSTPVRVCDDCYPIAQTGGNFYQTVPNAV
ncbi:FYVE-type zinc finger-containing protein [Histomonas meleagridis]|uniref:FYVE-type zinc finger-containing protein n=1 Tax=Histomonas meleagridis TaxID=135588 RepID=UPI00355A82A4|nr:FYVE-type zinc finger-containing protein [Histomonas meleagridis]KAH0805123.1 FYVE-type zinc finger-containing protein [Histomonas meleagridis]